MASAAKSEVSTIDALTENGVKHLHDTVSTLKELSAKNVKVTLTNLLRPIPQPTSKELWASNACCDHMMTVKWTSLSGWEAPEIRPYGDISMSPVASCLHYATQCFEGMKVYRGYDGKLRLFRPDQNIARLQMSAERIALPPFDGAALIELMKRLLAIDGDRWLPKNTPGKFLYVRPAFIGTGPQIGIQCPEEALLFIVSVPWPDFSTETPPGKTTSSPGLRLIASKSGSIRAWPGGFGYAKVGANYGPSFVAHREAQSKGYDQILWLIGEEGRVTEAGASNFFSIIKNIVGELELVTAPLTDKVILAGVTRRSVIDLVNERLHGELKVVEKDFTMDYIQRAQHEGRIVEAFVSGTAFFITPISVIHYKDTDIEIPLAEGITGKYARTIKAWLSDIMYGNVNHEWGVVIEE